METFAQIAEVFLFLRSFSLWTTMLRLLLAFVLGGVIGLEREKRSRTAGLRTHILVCLGTATVMLTGQYAVYELGLDSDTTRLGAQVISGIGFLGAGTILVRNSNHVRGLTTAACLWVTASIGLALGAGYYECAIFCAILVYFSTHVLYKMEQRFYAKHGKLMIYMEVSDAKAVNRIIRLLEMDPYRAESVEVVQAKSNTANHVGIAALTVVRPGQNRNAYLDALAAEKDVAFAIEMN